MEFERDLQRLVEANMEEMLGGVRFLATEYSTGPVHRGRIDSLGLDEDGSPVLIEYKRTSSESVLAQGLFYLSWTLLPNWVNRRDLANARGLLGGAFGPAACFWMVVVRLKDGAAGVDGSEFGLGRSGGNTGGRLRGVSQGVPGDAGPGLARPVVR
ncbi:hypothetical protein ACIOGZ_29290 [Kitasatospora sp. NPDC088160]|uniref:hypothetical protein n=1 Tax=Kitasatospora sp. NPDC088160 TaxID=3364072 RepID=UPI003802017F